MHLLLTGSSEDAFRASGFSCKTTPPTDLRLGNGVLLTDDLRSSIGDTKFGNGEDVDDVLAHLPEYAELLLVCTIGGNTSSF